jgi:hypothetical protein
MVPLNSPLRKYRSSEYIYVYKEDNILNYSVRINEVLLWALQQSIANLGGYSHEKIPACDKTADGKIKDLR